MLKVRWPANREPLTKRMVPRYDGTDHAFQRLNAGTADRASPYVRSPANQWGPPEFPSSGGVAARQGWFRSVRVTLRFGPRKPLRIHRRRLQGRNLEGDAGNTGPPTAGQTGGATV